MPARVGRAAARPRPPVSSTRARWSRSAPRCAAAGSVATLASRWPPAWSSPTAAAPSGSMARAGEELRATGARPRRLARTGVDALTASERRAARLAAEGRSNAQVAQELFVSLKTVETHLTHAYAKLGLTGPGRGACSRTCSSRRGAEWPPPRIPSRSAGVSPLVAVPPPASPAVPASIHVPEARIMFCRPCHERRSARQTRRDSWRAPPRRAIRRSRRRDDHDRAVADQLGAAPRTGTRG